MKRNPKLIKDLLINIQGNNEHSDIWLDMLIKDKKNYDKEKVVYHLKLLKDDGYIEAIEIRHLKGGDIIPQRLTNKGHDYLEFIQTPWWKKLGYKVFEVSGKITWIIVGASITLIVTHVFESFL